MRQVVSNGVSDGMKQTGLIVSAILLAGGLSAFPASRSSADATAKQRVAAIHDFDAEPRRHNLVNGRRPIGRALPSETLRTRSRKNPQAAPDVLTPAIGRIIRQAGGQTQITGWAQPGTLVIINRNGHRIGEGITSQAGEWSIQSTAKITTGHHHFTLHHTGNLPNGFILGDEARISIPHQFNGRLDLKLSTRPNLPWINSKLDFPDRTTTLRYASQQSHTTGSVVVPVPDAGKRTRIAQGPAPRRSPPDAVIGQSTLQPARDWATRSHEAYQREIVPRLARGSGASGAPAKPEEVKRERDLKRNDKQAATAPAKNPREPWSDWVINSVRSYNSTILPRLTGEKPLGLQQAEKPAKRPAITSPGPNVSPNPGRWTAEDQRRADAARAREAARLAEIERRDAEDARKVAERAGQRALAEAARIDQQQRRAAELERQAEARRLQQQQLERATEVARAEKVRKEAEQRVNALAEAAKSNAAAALSEAERRKREEVARQAAADRTQAERDRIARAERDRVERERLAQADAARRAQAQQLALRRQEPSRPTKTAPAVLPALPDRNTRRITLRTAPIRPVRPSLTLPDLPARRPYRISQTSRRPRTPSPPRTPAHTQRPGRNSLGAQVVAKPTKPTARRKATARRGAAIPSVRRYNYAGRCRRAWGRRIRPPGTYVVKPGDSLWRISRRHYALGHRYPRIYRANKAKIRDVDLIYPCQRFFIPRWRRLRD